MSYPYQYIETTNGGAFVGPNGKRHEFVKTDDHRDKRRAKAEMDAENRDYQPLTKDQRDAQRRAEHVAKQEVAAIQRDARKAAEPPRDSVNHARARQRELEKSWKREDRDKAKHFERMADDWDEEHGARIQEAEREAAIASTPLVKLAREHVAGLENTVPESLRMEAVRLRAHVEASPDGAESWRRIEAFRDAQFAEADRETAEKMAESNSARTAFVESASKAVLDRASFEAAKPKADPPRDESGRYRAPLPAADAIDQERADDFGTIRYRKSAPVL